VSEQIQVAVKKANAMLGMIKRNIKHRSKEVIVKLYKALVRPRLEYCVQVWSPYHRGDINMLERIQKRATKMIVGFQNYSYEERLRKTGLQCLEERRIRGDLIQVYKMIRGMDKLDYNKFFKIQPPTITLGHSYKLIKERSRLDIRKYFFSQRVVSAWNALPGEVVEAGTVNAFKNKLDAHSF
jgi:hypothetical protein